MQPEQPPANERGILSIINALMWFAFPVLLIMLLGTFQAQGSVFAGHEKYKDAPYVTSIAELEEIEDGTLVLVRGVISMNNPPYLEDMVDPEMIVFWEVPANGQKPTPEQADAKVFPDLNLTLEDGDVRLLVDPEGVVIEEEPASVRNGDNNRVGFRRLDTGMVSGEVQRMDGDVVVAEVTGITGETHAEFLDRLESPVGYFKAFQRIVAVLTVLSGIWFGVLVARTRRAEPDEDEPPEPDDD